MNIKVLYIRTYKNEVTQPLSSKKDKIGVNFYHNSTILYTEFSIINIINLIVCKTH